MVGHHGTRATRYRRRRPAWSAARAAIVSGGALVAVGVGLGSLESLAAEPADSGGTPSAARAACDANRLHGTLERLELSASGAEDSGVNLTLTPSGAFQGLAYGVASDGLETHLSFTIAFEEPTLLRNPERPQLFALNLSRNDLGSDHPGTVLTFDPHRGSTGHPAHRALGALVLDALAEVPRRQRRVWLVELPVGE